MTILGGTLGQLIMPAVAIVALIVTGNDTFGAFVMLIALAWGAWLLLQQYRNLERDI